MGKPRNAFRGVCHYRWHHRVGMSEFYIPWYKGLVGIQTIRLLSLWGILVPEQYVGQR